MTPRFIARQLSRPEGFVGRVVARMMNRRNGRMNAFTVEQLNVRRSDRVLEIGFGGGVNLPVLITKAGFLAGIDPSQQMVQQAEKRYADYIVHGRAAFHTGKVEELPFNGSLFAKVCTVNTIYFWTSLEAGLSEICRVLIPGGQAAIGFLPKEWMDRLGMPSDIFTPRTIAEVVAAAEKVGLGEVSVRRPKPSTAWSVVVARR